MPTAKKPARPTTTAKTQTKRPRTTGVARPAKAGKTTAKRSAKPAATRSAKPAAKKAAPRRPSASAAKPTRPAKKPTLTVKITHTPFAPTAPAPIASAFSTPPPALPTLPADAPEILTHCLRALDDKKADGLQVLDVRGKSSVTDFFIIATANSETHLRALRIAVEKELDEAGAKVVGHEASAESGWSVVDAFDVIIHLFLADKRAAYDIEGLWAKSPRP